MMVQPRLKLYGTPKNYWIALKSIFSGGFSSGDDIHELESALQVKLGCAHAIMVTQARYGIYLAVRRLLARFNGRRKVILSPYTIYDAVNMVIAAGGEPVFCDIDPVTCNIDCGAAEKLVGDLTAGILITHLHGLAADTARFKRLCEKHDIFLVEDAAQALGARNDGCSVGTLGNAGILSFGRVKNVNAFFGGAILTNDDELAAQIRQDLNQTEPLSTRTLAKRMLSCFIADIATAPGVFQSLTFPLLRFGAIRGMESINKLVNTEDYPKRLDSVPEAYQTKVLPIQARFVLAQLNAMDADTDQRIKNARRYDAGLSNLQFLKLPPADQARGHAYLAYPIQLTDRMEFVRELMRKGCDVTIQHYQNAADLDCFADYHRDCPNARKTAEEVVLLPTYPGFKTSSIDKIVRTAKTYEPASTSQVLTASERP